MPNQLKIRQSAVAGFFYPEDPQTLDQMVEKYLAEAKKPDVSSPAPKAIIAPHAGYIYSGPVAASVYKLLEKNKSKIRRVVLLGPAHRVGFEGLAASSADFFFTPLGKIAIDLDAQKKILDLKQVKVFDQAHAEEHSLEVHLPFLQKILDDFKLIPLVVGDAAPIEVSEVLAKIWGGEETVIVISSDLSHYLDYQSAQKIDEQTRLAIENLNPKNIKYNQACGRNPVNGLLAYAKLHGMKVKTVDLRNSGDTAGSLDRVVGYGSWAFWP